MGNIPAVMEPI